MRKSYRILTIILLVFCIFTVPVFADDTDSSDDTDTGNIFVDALKSVFLPNENFFIYWTNAINEELHDKFDGILNACNALSDTIKNFDNYQDVSGIVEFKTGLLAGKSFDFFKFDDKMLNIFRFGFSGFMIILTVVYTARRIIVIVRGGGSGV